MSDMQNDGIVHGALDYGELARLGLQPSEILDFSVNSNPFGPSPCVREAIADVTIDRYPDRACLKLRQAILDYEMTGARLALAALICGNGTSELIWSVARAYLKPGARTLIIGPTFGEYRAASLTVGAIVSDARAREAADFQPDCGAFCAQIRYEQPTLVWLCNPNNPTGAWLEQQSIEQITHACQCAGALLVIDESYWHFVLPQERYSAIGLTQTDGLLVLRSLTKDFALAGLRLGYAVGTPAIIERLNAQLPSWNVSGVAQEAGIAALSDRAHLKSTLKMLADERQAFFDALRADGWHVVPSRTHFCLIEVGNSQNVRRQLLQRKILVRDCTSFGLPTYLRVATRQRSEWQQLVQALREVR